jgi:hypothetical protein
LPLRAGLLHVDVYEREEQGVLVGGTERASSRRFKSFSPKAKESRPTPGQEIEEETGLPRASLEPIRSFPELLAYELPPKLRSETGSPIH